MNRTRRSGLGSLYDLKPTFQRLLQPLVNHLARARTSPNHVTTTALALSLVGGTLLTAQPEVPAAWLLLPPLLLVRMALNAIDGMLARLQQRATPGGMLLNELGDVVSDVVLYLPLALVPGVPATLVVLVVVLGLLTEFAGLAAVAAGAERRNDGPLGKSDRALLFGIVGLLLGFGVAPGSWLVGLLAGLVPLLGWTVLRRCRWAWTSIEVPS